MLQTSHGCDQPSSRITSGALQTIIMYEFHTMKMQIVLFVFVFVFVFVITLYIMVWPVMPRRDNLAVMLPVERGGTKVNQTNLKISFNCIFVSFGGLKTFSHLCTFNFPNIFALSGIVRNLPVGGSEQNVLWLKVGVG